VVSPVAVSGVFLVIVGAFLASRREIRPAPLPDAVSGS